MSFKVFEHVFDIEKALSQIPSILKLGGMHIFSMPVVCNFLENTVVRTSMVKNKIVHQAGPHYYIAGNGSKSLVVSDFGADFVDMHQKSGLDLSIVRASAPSTPMNQNASFVARKR